MSTQAPEREVVESILQEVAMKSKLDADDVHVQVPELLLRECEAEIQRVIIIKMFYCEYIMIPSHYSTGYSIHYL